MVGSVKPLYVDDVDGIHTPLSGEQWLKTGYISTDIITYPDAKQGFSTGGVYSGTSWTTVGGNPQGIAWDGTFFYVLDDSGNKVYKFDSAGTPVTNWTAGTAVWVAMAWTGSDLVGLYVTGGVSHLVTLNDGGGYTYINNLGIDSDALTSDGTYLYAFNNTTESVHKFTMVGVSTGTPVSISAQLTDAQGFAWDGTYFYAASMAGIVHQFNSDWSPTGESFSTVTQTDTTVVGLTYDGTHLVTTNYSNDTAHFYSGWVPYIGILTAEFDESTGLPIYLKIKE